MKDVRYFKPEIRNNQICAHIMVYIGKQSAKTRYHNNDNRRVITDIPRTCLQLTTEGKILNNIYY